MEHALGGARRRMYAHLRTILQRRRRQYKYKNKYNALNNLQTQLKQTNAHPTLIIFTIAINKPN